MTTDAARVEGEDASPSLRAEISDPGAALEADASGDGPDDVLLDGYLPL